MIRVAGNVIDSHQLGSIDYAAEHLGCPLVLVIGHDHCGAVDTRTNDCSLTPGGQRAIVVFYCIILKLRYNLSM